MIVITIPASSVQFSSKVLPSSLIQVLLIHVVTNVCLGHKVLKQVVVKSSVFRDITSCSPLKVNRRFGSNFRAEQ
jgi:hypothetical protein